MIQRRTRSILTLFAVPLAAALVIGLGAAAAPVRDPDAPLWLEASLSSRKLTVMKGDSVVKQYDVAVGHPNHPTPTGSFTVRKLIWNPAWVPPDEKWARGKKPTPPGAKNNPMKMVKIFFQEPDYYIHGTGAVESLGEAASHGCLRMDPNEAGEVALMLMDNSGTAKDWDWVKGILHLGEQRAVGLATPVTMVVEH
jgi:lipoprotein-anchoring transpeptidase ErfK/SrfK